MGQSILTRNVPNAVRGLFIAQRKVPLCQKHPGLKATARFRVHFGRGMQKRFKSFEDAERFSQVLGMNPTEVLLIQGTINETTRLVSVSLPKNGLLSKKRSSSLVHLQI